MSTTSDNDTKSVEQFKQQFIDSIKPAQGKLIAFFYTLCTPSGEELDSNYGGEPMVFQSGAGEMLLALEEAVVKLEAGQSISIVLPPEKAFGPVQEQQMREFPLSSIPEEVRQVGRHVMVRGPDGEERMLEVVGIRDDVAVIDFNHEYAGQTLQFNIEVISSEPFSQ